MDSSCQKCNAIVLIWYSVRKTVFLFLFNVIQYQLFWYYIPWLLLFQLISRAVLPTPIYGVHMSPSSVIGIRSNSDPFLSFFTLSLLYFLIFLYSSSRNADMHSVLHTDSP